MDFNGQNTLFCYRCNAGFPNQDALLAHQIYHCFQRTPVLQPIESSFLNQYPCAQSTFDTNQATFNKPASNVDIRPVLLEIVNDASKTESTDLSFVRSTKEPPVSEKGSSYSNSILYPYLRRPTKKKNGERTKPVKSDPQPITTGKRIIEEVEHAPLENSTLNFTSVDSSALTKFDSGLMDPYLEPESQHFAKQMSTPTIGNQSTLKDILHRVNSTAQLLQPQQQKVDPAKRLAIESVPLTDQILSFESLPIGQNRSLTEKEATKPPYISMVNEAITRRKSAFKELLSIVEQTKTTYVKAVKATVLKESALKDLFGTLSRETTSDLESSMKAAMKVAVFNEVSVTQEIHTLDWKQDEAIAQVIADIEHERVVCNMVLSNVIRKG